MYAFAIWDCRDAQAGHDPRPDGHQAALLLPDARRRAVRLRAEGDPGQPARRASRRRRRAARAVRFTSRRRGTPSGRACTRSSPARSSPSTRTASASAATGAWSARAHRRPGHHGRARARAARRHRAPPAGRRRARCVLLSGGLDSSAITALAARELASDDRCAASRSTSSARPSTSSPTSCARRRHAVRARRRRHVGAEHHDIVLDHDAARRPRPAPQGHRRPRPPDRPRRHGRLAVPAVQGDPRALDGRAVRRVRRRGLRRLPAVPRPGGPAARRLPLARDRTTIRHGQADAILDAGARRRARPARPTSTTLRDRGGRGRAPRRRETSSSGRCG